MKKILCFILFVLLLSCCGCGKQEGSISQEEVSQDDEYLYRILCDVISYSVEDFPDCWTDCWGDRMTEDPSGKAWTFEFDDELDVYRYNVDISINVEMLEELKARYAVCENGEEVDSFEAFLFSEPPDLKALYVDITDDGSREVVIIGSTDSGGFESAPWVYAYDRKNRERISLFDSDEENYSSCLTERQTKQLKEIVEKDGRFNELFPSGRISYDDGGCQGGIPMVDASGNVYFQIHVWGSDFLADIDGNVLLFLDYNAETKEFDVIGVLYDKRDN